MNILNDIRLIGTLVFVGINCNNALKSNGTAAKDLNAQTLIAFGREFNNSLVTLIGKVIENYHMCTAWSQWTECGTSRFDFFSTRTRSRQCRKEKSRTGGNAEIETDICEGDTENITEKVCPLNYSMTANGFCMRLYTTQKTHDDAQSMCNNDEGFLINIDSDQKYTDAKVILIANGITTQVQIDGRRKTGSSPWEYRYGSRSGYFHWFPSYPSTRGNCLRLSGYRSSTDQRFRTYSTNCDGLQPFLCEVPV